MHPAFAFLVFNLLVRFRNQVVAQVRVQSAAFERVLGIRRRLTPGCLEAAQEEMRTSGRKQYPGVLALMDELSLYRYR